MQREADRDGDPGIELQPDERQSVIDDEQLHQQRRALEQGDIAGRRTLQQRAAGGARQRDAEPGDAAADEADRRERERPFQAGEQEQELG